MILLALALAAWAPATAEAGTYHVYACSAGGASWGNHSWTGPPVPGLVVDTDCTQGALIGLRIDGGKAIANGASAALTFTSPPGTTIADFTLDRQLDFRSNPPLADTRPLYALYLLGGVPFIGAGDYHHPTRERLNPFGALVRLSRQNNATLAGARRRCGSSARSPATRATRPRSRSRSAASSGPRTAPGRPAGASTTCSTGST